MGNRDSGTVILKHQNENTLYRNTGYIETSYNKLRIPYNIMWQLVKTNRLIDNGKFYKVELETVMKHHTKYSFSQFT